MSLKPKKSVDLTKLISHFSDSGQETKKYSLIRAVYNEWIEDAEKILKADPDQINIQDPFAGLSALDIAIFRQNEKLVRLLARYPNCNLRIKDNFGRRPVDMLDYNAMPEIFEIVTTATYRDSLRALDDIEYEHALASRKVIPFKPPEPK